jgi:ATP-dependent protease Clp ATPase subunit
VIFHRFRGVVVGDGSARFCVVQVWALYIRYTEQEWEREEKEEQKIETNMSRVQVRGPGGSARFYDIA